MKTFISCINKKIIKYILFFLTFFSVISFSFAVEINSSNGGGSFGSLFVSIVDLLGSIWMVFPIIAGKLLTNDLVYGTALYLDSTLWKIWNFSRTVANYLIGFLFIYMIFRYLLYFQDKDASLIKTGLPKVILASILVNMSWFLLAVLIDLSTIFIAAFGTMAGNMGIKTPKLVMPKNIEITVEKCDPSKSTACIKGSQNLNIKDKTSLTLSDLQTYETNISGPLMFLGMSVLEIPTSKSKLLNDAYDAQAQKFKHDGRAIKAMIKIFIFLMFIIPIIILIVVNIIRLFWLWMYISFSPLLVLDWIWGKNKLAGANKAFGLKNAIGLIFSPALVVLGFSISIIFILGIVDALNTTEGPNEYTDKVKEKFLLNGGNGIVQIDFGQVQDSSQSASKYIGGFFGYLIITILIVMMIWSIMKLSFKASEVTSGVAGKMFEFSENLFKTIPMPTPLGQVSVGSLGKLGQTVQNIPNSLITKQSQQLDKLFNRESDITSKKLQEIQTEIRNSTTKSSGIKHALQELSRFKGKVEIESSDNTKKLIDYLINQINLSNSLSKVKADLNGKTKYKDKLDVILANQNDIEKNL